MFLSVGVLKVSGIIPEALSGRLFEAIRSSPHPYIFTFLDKGGDGEAVRYTPAALLTAAMAYGEKLSSLLGAQRRVLLCMDAGPECIVAIVAGVFHGITLVPLPLPLLQAERQRLRNILDRDGGYPILCDEKAAHCFHEHDDLGRPVDILRIGLQALDVEAWQARDNRPPPPPADHPVIIQYTSGSTGAPKGVVVTQRNLLANFQLVAEEWRFSPGKSVLSWLPHYHDMGLFGGILFPLLGGMQIVVMRSGDFIRKPSRWLAAIDRYRINYSGGPAFAFQLCCERIDEQELAGLDLSCWQVAFCGADYVSQRVLDAFRVRFRVAGLQPRAVMACYGMAEYTLYVAGTRDWDEPTASRLDLDGSGYAGCRLGPGWEERIRIVPAAGKTQADAGAPGNIYISGASASPGYLDGDLPVFVDVSGRWLDTGDLGFVQDGFLVVTGREKNMLTLHGRNLMVHDLAASACEACDELNPLACVVFEHPEDQRLMMLIEGRSKSVVGQGIDIAAMRQKVYRDFGVSLKEIHIVGRGYMPRTSSGKVQVGQTISRFMQARHE
ncbi:AMP-binding protein [Stutzerimonas kirkiae]|uniref:AMP-binding protein n=1 Tax=Stutzerimonas kirkiae TaxID=2211392 RepID=UPI0010383EBF|nr:AMP-binding protein [Stutzerimonas kirkiae]TBV11173.1 hypothetical protein DNK08_04385 [Stutzerimonas kirkiae]